MGDGADMAIEAMMDEEDARLEYHTGNMTDGEAYDRGLIDELGHDLSGQANPRSTSRTCRCCGQPGLKWGQADGKWRLFDSKGMHNCPKNPLKLFKESGI